MGFFAPWFLAGAAAVALPFYLHLLRRHTTNPQPFSSLMFFERRTQSSIKHRRLRYLLLLSLRALLLILLALAFANPFIQRSAASAGGDHLLLLVIDNSFSMRAGTRLADAQRAALSVLASRGPSERAEVMALGSQLQILAQPTQDTAILRTAVESVKPGDSRASYGELARALRTVSQTVRTPIDLHLFSDMQKSAMPASFAELALPPNTSLFLHPVAKGAVPNWTVESVTAPAQVWDPKKAPVEVVVTGYGTEAATRTVSLVVNRKTIATRSVTVPANGRASVDFPTLDVPYGFSRCEARIDSADSFPGDDVRRFAVQRSDPRRALFIHDSSDSRSLVYFQAALSASAEPAFDLDSATVGQGENLALSKYAFVVVSDVLSLPSSFENALVRYVRGGGSVWIAAGTSTARAARIPVMGDKILEPLYYANRGGQYLTVGDADSSYPSLQKTDRWSGVKFYFALRVDPADTRVVTRLTDQTPLLLEKKMGEGNVLLFTSGFDNLTNDFPLHPVFVPFIEQTAWYLAGLAREGGSRVVDSYLEMRTSKEKDVSVVVIDPNGRRSLTLQQAAAMQNYQVTQAGFYELQLANGRHDLVGVNPDPRESDLAVIPDATLALWRGNPAAGQKAAANGPAQRETSPTSVWWYVMVLVLAVALAESLVANQYLRTPREEP